MDFNQPDRSGDWGRIIWRSAVSVLVPWRGRSAGNDNDYSDLKKTLPKNL